MSTPITAIDSLIEAAAVIDAAAAVVDVNANTHTELFGGLVDSRLSFKGARTDIEGMQMECDFYFGKLRQLETLCEHSRDEDKTEVPLSQVFDILYATQEGFAAPEETEMELSVKTLDSQTHIFTEVDGEITVSDFKALISPVVALPPEQQRLIFRGRVLQNEKKLKDYDVASGHVLHLVGRHPANSSASNDQPSATNRTNGGGRNNALIMGTIGSMDLTAGQGQGPPLPRRTAASVRLQVALENMNRAGRLLDTLEQELTLRLQEEAADPTEEDEEDDLALALGHHAAVVASIRRTDPTVTIGNTTVTTAVPPTNTENSNSAGDGNTTGTGNNSTPVSNTSEGGAGRQVRRASRNPEAPMLRELATTINDLLSLNERVTPHLRTVERWLRQNAELSESQTSVQYTYNTVTSILHSLSHSLHAISDITVDFSLPPTSRRLRAPTSVLVEQSTVLRATIPVGLQFGIGGGGAADMGGAQVLGINLEGAGITGPGQGMNMNMNMAPAGLQQAIASILQGAMFPHQHRATPPPAPAAQPQQQQRTTDAQDPPPTGRLPGPTEQAPWVFPPGPPAQAPPVNHSDSAPQLSSGTPAGSATAGPGAPASGQGQGPTLQSLMGAIQGGQHRRRDILLNCHSQHNVRASPNPARPVGLTQFLSQEMDDGLTRSQDLDREYFDMLVGFTQILNTAHPAMIHYVQGNMLRGRDVNNPNHVLTGVRSYGRRFAEWIVSALPAQSAENTTSLTANLAEVTAKFLAKVVETILSTPAGSPITSPLHSLLNEWLPKFIDVFRAVFPDSEYKEVLKGVIYLIVAALFPSTPLTFRSRLTAGLAQYVNCIAPQSEPMAQEPVVETAELELDIDMEIEVGDPEIVESEHSTPVQSGSENRSPVVERIDHPIPNSDSEDELQSEYQSVTSELLQHLPSAWHRTVLTDIERQEGLRNGDQEQPPFSPGFLSIFPQK